MAVIARGGSAPYIANVIGQSSLDTFCKQLAHATVNAALAAVQGKDPLAMAAGASSAELVGIIASQVYGLEVNELSEDKKQTVSALATLAAGLAAGLVGGDTESTLAGMQAGKVTVENNYLSSDDIKTFTDKYAKAKTDTEKEALMAELKKLDIEQQKQALYTGISINAQKEVLADLKTLAASPECIAKCQELTAYSISELEPVANNTQLHEDNLKKGILASVIYALTIEKPTSVSSGSGLSLLTKEQQQLIRNAETITTAKGIQNPYPRDLNEKVLWNGVKNNPSNGQPLKGMNNDPRFPASAGFQKMQVSQKLSDGSSITIHYQYNSNTGKAYDMKITTPQREPSNPSNVIDKIKETIK